MYYLLKWIKFSVKKTNKPLKNIARVREKSRNFVSPEKWEPCCVTRVQFKLQENVSSLTDAKDYIVSQWKINNVPRDLLEPGTSFAYALEAQVNYLINSY